MTYLVVGGLVLLVGLVVVLVALGMRAGRAHDDDDDDWMTDEPQQRPRRAGAEAAPGEDEAGYDLRVAGAPLAAPVPSAPAAAPRRGKATQEMGDDDYWATITFDKPKFPWQHENGGQPPADAPLHNEPEPEHVAAGVDDPFADSYGQGYAEQEYVEQPGAYAEQTFAEQFAEQQFADQTFADQPFADQQFADQQFSDQPFAEPQPFSEPAFGEYREDYGDQYREPVDIPVAGHAGSFEPEPLPLRPDPLEPSALDWPAPPQPTSMPERSYEQTTIDRLPPVERPTAPKSDPLGLPEFVRPAARADSRDPEATQSYPIPGSPYSSGPINPNPLSSSPLSTGPLSGGPRSTGPQSMGPLGGQSPLNKPNPLSPPSPLSGQSPLSTTGPLSPPPVSANPLSTSYTPEPQQPSSTDTDGQRLPTVDELLQKIQADRRKTETPATSYNAGSLTDPLNDPLVSGERDPSYGSSWSSPTPAAPSARSYDSDPLSGGNPGYGSYGTDGYPTTPAYGEPPRYDDPRAGYQSGTPSASAGSYPGSYGESTPEPGRYGDFTGSSFNGTGSEPGQAPNSQNAQTGQAPPNAGGYYPGEQGFYGAPTPEPPSAPPAYPSGPYEKQPASSEEWDSYRDYRH